MFDHPEILLNYLEKSNLVERNELEFGHFIYRLNPEIPPLILLTGMAQIHFKQKGHVAINQDLFDEYLGKIEVKGFDFVFQEDISSYPAIGSPGNFEPFIYDSGLIYDHKSHSNEARLSEWLKDRLHSQIEFSVSKRAELDYRFADRYADRQLLTIYNSFFKRLQFVTGGPGTGKTYTVKEIIKEHRLYYGDEYEIKIAAPTGKAAQRINESFVDWDEDIQAATIHQLIGATNNHSGFKFNKDQKLKVDLLIIDEASMMDLSLWVAIIDSLPDFAKLVVVGDPFQLSSVESGAVLSDICTMVDSEDSFKESIVMLTKNFRFSGSQGIQNLSDSINDMDSDRVLSLLNDDSFVDISSVTPSKEAIDDILEKYAIEPARKELFEETNSTFKILTALRNGPYGCTYLNELIETKIKKQKGVSSLEEWFDGRLIMINKNDYALNLQNGEIGTYSGNDDSIHFGNHKVIPKKLIHNYESGYCITVHKSQGSEFENVAIILPDDKSSILSKELFYTAVTRARQSVLVFGNEQIIAHTVAKEIVRTTGLKQKLKT